MWGQCTFRGKISNTSSQYLFTPSWNYHSAFSSLNINFRHFHMYFRSLTLIVHISNRVQDFFHVHIGGKCYKFTIFCKGIFTTDKSIQPKNHRRKKRSQ